MRLKTRYSISKITQRGTEMRNKNSKFSKTFCREKNVVRFYILLILLLTFMFFTNDFGFVEAQKTAIVTAVGIDREDNNFIVTSQIALPQTANSGTTNNASSPSSVQLTSRGKTVADAFNQINAKTGWYPKLVFCNLIILGEKAVQKNIFDALDFFLRNEYALDSALVCTCKGDAKELLNTPTSTDQCSGLALEKVISTHAKQVGTALPNSLRELASNHYSEASCSFLPIVTAREQKEKIGEDANNKTSREDKKNDGSEKDGNNHTKEERSMVFNASKTALFKNGVMVGEFNEDETLVFGLIKNKIRLAEFTVEDERESFTLDIKNNRSSVKFTANNEPHLDVKITIRTGISDFSNSVSRDFIKDTGVLSQEKLQKAEEKTTAFVMQIFKKCQTLDCDLFELLDALKKYEFARYEELKDEVLQTTTLSVTVKFKNVR